MADKATAPIEVRRQKLIIDVLCRHVAYEAQAGQDRAIEEGIAEMIGAAEYLVLRLGRRRARDAVREMLDAL
jgi:hypothetical protein